MKSIQKNITVFFLAIAVIFTQISITAYEANAASNAKERATTDTIWKKIYKEHLKSIHMHTRLGGYYVIDIDKNGTPELITAYCELGTTTYKVYTVQADKLTTVGEIKSTGSYIPVPIIRYSSKYKALHVYRGHKNYGLSGESLYVMSNGKLKEKFYAQTIYPEKVYFKGNDWKNTKKISKSAYDAYMKKYIKTYKAYKMIPNTIFNRNKSFG